MTTQETLIAKLRAAFPDDSQAALGRRAGLEPQRFNNYVLGVRKMDDDAIIGCATALGIDPAPLVKAHRADTATTTRERHFWRSVAVIALCAIGTSIYLIPQDISIASVYLMFFAALATLALRPIPAPRPVAA